MYLTQFFPENTPVVELCAELLNYPTMKQYQNEEHALMKRRVSLASRRLEALFDVMQRDEISPPEKIAQLRDELADYHESDAFSQCRTMGDLVRTNVDVTLAK